MTRVYIITIFGHLRTGLNDVNQALGLRCVSFAAESEVEWQRVRRFNHHFHVIDAWRARGGISSCRGTSAAANHRCDTV